MQGVQGHSHGNAGIQRAVEGGGQAEQGEQPKGRGRKKRKRKGAAGQGANGAQALAGGGAGATVAGGGAAAGMAGCPMAKGGAATLGTTAPAGLSATPANSQAPTTAGAAGTTAPTASAELALGAPAAAPTSPLIQSALAEVGGSKLAQQVLQSLGTSGAQIETVSDAEMAQEFGARTKGAFDPKTNKITLPESVAKNPAELRLVLFHEGVHWLQDNVKGGAEALGGPIGDALRSAGAVRQTAAGKADLQHDEAQAYVLEAMLANELGIKDSGLGVDGSGRALSYDAVLQKVKQTAEYA